MRVELPNSFQNLSPLLWHGQSQSYIYQGPQYMLPVFETFRAAFIAGSGKSYSKMLKLFGLEVEQRYITNLLMIIFIFLYWNNILFGDGSNYYECEF